MLIRSAESITLPRSGAAPSRRTSRRLPRPWPACCGPYGGLRRPEDYNSKALSNCNEIQFIKYMMNASLCAILIPPRVTTEIPWNNGAQEKGKILEKVAEEEPQGTVESIFQDLRFTWDPGTGVTIQYLFLNDRIFTSRTRICLWAHLHCAKIHDTNVLQIPSNFYQVGEVQLALSNITYLGLTSQY